MSLQQALTAATEAEATVSNASEVELLTAYKEILDDPMLKAQMSNLRRIAFALKDGESRGVFDMTNQLSSSLDHGNQVVTNRLAQLRIERT